MTLILIGSELIDNVSLECQQQRQEERAALTDGACVRVHAGLHGACVQVRGFITTDLVYPNSTKFLSQYRPTVLKPLSHRFSSAARALFSASS